MNYRLSFLNHIPPKQTTGIPEELGSHTRYRVDDAIEWALSASGRENIALAVGAAACIGLIVVLHHG